MNLQNFQKNTITICAIVLVSSVIRYLNVTELNDTQFAQFSPLMAMFLFAGSRIRNSFWALSITLGTMLVSDLLIHQLYYKGQYGVLYGGWYWTYALFIGITLLGKFGIKKVTIPNVLFTGIGAAVVYFLISNFIVWASGGTDARTNFTTPLAYSWDGLKQCYIQAIPFFRNNAIATVLYSGVMFGVFEMIKSKSNNRLAFVKTH